MTGLCQSAELELLRGRVRVIHIHDNDGITDSHRTPFSCPAPTGNTGCSPIDWADAAEGLRLCDFLSCSNRCLNLELKTSDLPADGPIRSTHAAEAIRSAKKLASML